MLHRLRQLVPRRLDVEAEMPRERLDELEIVGVAAIPAADGAAGQRQARVDHHAGGIEELLYTQAAAGAAGARRVVEGKEARLETCQAVAAHGAGEAVREHERLAAGIVRKRDACHALREGERGLERLRQTLTGIPSHAQSIDYDVDAVPPPRVETWRRLELDQPTVDERADEALGAQLLERLEMLALAILHDRREKQHARFFRQREHLVDHLAHGLRREFLAVLGTARQAGPCVEHAQVVVDLGHRPDGGARVVRRRLLLDRDRGRQPLDMIDIRLFHHRQELPCVRRQRLDVAALPLGVDRVEGERGLARARQPGDDDQPVARQVQVDAPQVMSAGTADAYDVHGGSNVAASGQPVTIRSARRARQSRAVVVWGRR